MSPSPEPAEDTRYRGRLAPTPSGWLHLGHARTFQVAAERARRAGGALILRVEDIDRGRCRPEFEAGMLEDLRWLGLGWEEGPDVGGPRGPYRQSERLERHRAMLERLRKGGRVYPCRCSRRDVREAGAAPHEADGGVLYPGTCRPGGPGAERAVKAREICWRFRVPDGEAVSFVDGRLGRREFVAGRDFGDFVVWRREDGPSYELAVAVDDAAMGITEVVRGEDLLVSTARQLLLYRALGLRPPAFYHCPLVLDEAGKRLAKRTGATALREMRAAGRPPPLPPAVANAVGWAEA
ncbi:MAG: tRNA glutamyl-Q(34) synthetase GluQRS [Puniceicoccaceae bacterium]|nr:MAG: tRNA glutamyl-Q(34) synthetase GluQRS [Puniceicoccaceae bacterium]